MIKRTLYFGNPAYLHTGLKQLFINLINEEKPRQIPIEDIGILILDHPQITITQPTLSRLLHNNVAVITCDETHHPIGLFLPLAGHTLQSQKFQAQISATIPLKKQLWQQTVMAKLTTRPQF